jgi:2-methylcitrate dehydratase PrpD
MSLKSWAEQLCCVSAESDIVDLHVQDTVAAFFVGARTKDGQGLARLYRERAGIAEHVGAAAAIARLSECDDIHLASCVTPGSVVIPVALALAGHRSINEISGAIAAGYAAGLTLGVAIGGAKALANGVWPSLLAAPLMAAVTASVLGNHDPHRLAHAMALSLAGTSGRVGRPAGANTGRWFLFAEAVSKGVRASEAADRGFHGDIELISTAWLAGQGGHDTVDMTPFTSTANAPSISSTGFKPFPIARQAANAVAAFQQLLANGLNPRLIDSINVFVPASNVALLTRAMTDDDRLSRLCNIGFQLASAALAPEVLYDAERAPRPALLEFGGRVTVTRADDLDTHLPELWPARVVVHIGGERVEQTILRTDFDAGARDLSGHLRGKWHRLLLPDDGDFSAHPTELWQRIERRVTMPAQHD